jgi:hypothetical protein
VIWMTVATTSQVMKIQSNSFGGSGAYFRPTTLIIAEMMVYIAAEKKL